MSKKILFTLLFFTANISFGQNKNDKTIYLDSIEKETTEGNHKYIRIIKDYHLKKDSYKVIEYYKSGIVKEECTYTDTKLTKLTGTSYYYHENGKLDQEYTPAQKGDSISKSLFYDQTGTLESEMLTNELSDKGTITYYYPNGSKKEIQVFDFNRSPKKWFVQVLQFWDTQNKHMVINGNGSYLIENENEKISGKIKNGNRIGTWTVIDKKAQVTEIEHYNNEGDFLEGTRTEKDGNAIIYTELESEAKPKNGFQHFDNYIGRNFKFTPEALKNKISGKVILEFTVETNGKISQLRIIKGLGYGLDEEAIRVISSYESWIPARQNGKAVKAKLALPLNLRRGY